MEVATLTSKAMTDVEKRKRIQELRARKNKLLSGVRYFEERAWHEAGHCVVGYLLGMPIDKCSIEIELPLGGNISKSKTKPPTHFYAKNPILSCLMILYAGYCVTFQRLEIHSYKEVKRLLYGATIDFEAADKTLSHVCKDRSSDASEALDAISRSNLDFLLSLPLVWSMVETIAKELLKNTSIGGDGIARIIEEQSQGVDIRDLILRMLSPEESKA